MADFSHWVGIDLGTTNSALAYIAVERADESSTILPIAQLDRPGAETTLEALPSFLYLPADSERDQLDGLEEGGVVGKYARSQAEVVPGRVVSSAKSWLVHDQVDRTANLLPWNSSVVNPAERVSPVTAATCYLSHLRRCWEREFNAAFADQKVCVTVPASFDEVAQRLTLEAARAAGYPKDVILLEEPQAAFYNWLQQRSGLSVLDQLIPEGRTSFSVLVVDVGGGTTDLSLFEVVRSESDRSLPEIKRVAVSDHLLLGGDNVDLALAHMLETRLSGEGKLSREQWSFLLAQSRALKERVLSQSGADSDPFHISVAAEGANLFSAARSAEIARGELKRLILEGFFPAVEASAEVQKEQRGFREWGLPYATDSAITRHIASFLAGRSIDAVLFNGGALTPEFLQKRLFTILQGWQPEHDLVQLRSESLDLAVAHGAAYHCALRSRSAALIGGGYSHGVYLVLDSENETESSQAVCLVSRGAAYGERYCLEDRDFSLLLNQPARFDIVSSVSRSDKVGAVVDLDESFHRLPALETTVGERSNENDSELVTLEATLSETGLLQLACIAKDSAAGEDVRQWILDFSIRQADQTSARVVELGVRAARVREALERIDQFYGRRKSQRKGDTPRGLMRNLEKVLGVERKNWSSALLRTLWTSLVRGVTRRGRSVDHEATWLYLAGFCLRPGYGADLDPYRVDELWRCFELGLSFPKEANCRNQWWIMWRRVAGGLSSDQQQQVWQKIKPLLWQGREDSPEIIRLAAGLERIAEQDREELAAQLVKRAFSVKASGREQFLYALGRLGSRVPLYSGVESVLRPQLIEEWFERLKEQDWTTSPYDAALALFAQAARRTGQRALDLDPQVQTQIAQKFKASKASPRQIEIVEEIVPVSREDRVQLFGESLPRGLTLLS